MPDSRRIALLTPHPPILVPEVGRGRDVDIRETADAMRVLADGLSSDPPQTLVIMSPHAPFLGASKVGVIMGARYEGSLAQFGAPKVAFGTSCDRELALAIADEAGADVLAVDAGASTSAPLDHGAMVPLSFLDREGRFPVVLINISLGGMATFERIGAAIGAGADRVGREIVFIASGDLSHRLAPDAPAGYAPDAKLFDKEIVSIVRSGDLDRLADLDPELVERAGECGLRSVYAAAGFVGPSPNAHEVLSYEGPFGVGYLVGRLAS